MLQWPPTILSTQSKLLALVLLTGPCWLLHLTFPTIFLLIQGLQKRMQEGAGQRERWKGAVLLALKMEGPWPKACGRPQKPGEHGVCWALALGLR